VNHKVTAQELRKLAELLRTKAAADETDRTQKCASLLVSAIGMEFLKSKIYGEP